MFVPQRNGSLSAVPIHTGAVIERSKADAQYSSTSNILTLSRQSVQAAFENARIAVYNDQTATDAEYEPSPVIRYSSARCRQAAGSQEYNCQFRVQYRHSSQWHDVEHQFRDLGDGRWIVAS